MTHMKLWKVFTLVRTAYKNVLIHSSFDADSKPKRRFWRLDLVFELLDFEFPINLLWISMVHQV